MKYISILAIVISSVVLVYTQATPKSSTYTISESFANDARAALIAINANHGIDDDRDVREAMSAVQVDGDLGDVATLLIHTDLLTLDIKSHSGSLSSVCVMEYAKELRSHNYSGLPSSCNP